MAPKPNGMNNRAPIFNGESYCYWKI